jgi:predicted nucleic acid-binding protein
VLERHELVVGEVLFHELEAALRSKLGLTEVHIDAVRAALATPDPVPRPLGPDPLRVSDPDDAWVVATAVAGRAEVLVTGDTALLAAAPDAPLPIVSPRGFWTLLRGAPPEG